MDIVNQIADTDEEEAASVKGILRKESRKPKKRNAMNQQFYIPQEILNAKYRKAVLKAKLANLQIVAQRQKDFVKQVEQFKSEKDGWECLWENQMQRFHEKIDSVKPILEKIENNIPAQDLNSLKRKFDQDFSVLAKKMKVDKENLENNA